MKGPMGQYAAEVKRWHKDELLQTVKGVFEQTNTREKPRIKKRTKLRESAASESKTNTSEVAEQEQSVL